MQNNIEKKAPFIEFKNVERSYQMGDRTFYALRDVNLELYEGEMVVILGPSGAGKSTLLNLLGGMDTPSAGEIIFDNKNIADFSDRELTEYRAWNVGVVFQFYNLVPTLTAYENVALMGDLCKSLRKKSVWNEKGEKFTVRAPEDALKSVGLEEHMHQFPSQMSGGEQQRTSIARAIAKNPRLLLCDEPTGALDTGTGQEILKLLQDMSRTEHRTVVMVTHNSVFAEIADRVIRVKNGRIQDVQTCDDPKSAEEVKW
ncbi:putative ABC transport system ATP-binding protein [Lachnospiraceae bacterium]|nr:putative ABC transport system ATP-binding protein [Lachnospiraceae bacterium]